MMTWWWWSDTWFFQVSGTVVAFALFLWYRHLTCNHGKWRALGVDGPEPALFFGNFADVVMGRLPLVTFVHQLYARFDGRRYFGVYGGREPLLIVRDPGLVHDVMVKDFGSFYDRTADDVSFKHDKLFNHLFNMRGEQWKALRSKLSPAFTATKLKSMLADINDCSGRLIDNLNGQIANNNGTHYNTDIIMYLHLCRDARAIPTIIRGGLNMHNARGPGTFSKLYGISHKVYNDAVTCEIHFFFFFSSNTVANTLSTFFVLVALRKVNKCNM